MIRRVDRYELLEQVGSGGMAVVYRGRDTALDREVAVKLLHPHLAARAESRARFSREARAVARLKHPNIVEIYDYAGDAAVESYLVTEFVRGRTLRAFADEENLEYPEIGALLARALADALVHAHAAGVIHRDLKPENVLVLEAGGPRAVKLVDFGIARILASDDRMTLTGALVGSPNHMAPEIIEGREADARSDVFSLGTILYWLAIGQMPFAAPNPTATLRRVIEGDYTDPRQASPLVSDELAAVMARALEGDPERRIPTAAALRDGLDAALAACDLRDPEGELLAFLGDPGGYKQKLRPRLIASALKRADVALAAGETAHGMKLLDRVLAHEPENAVVAARLRRIGLVALWKRRARRASGVVAMAALLAAAIWAGLAWHHRRAASAAAAATAQAARPQTKPPRRDATGASRSPLHGPEVAAAAADRGASPGHPTPQPASATGAGTEARSREVARASGAAREPAGRAQPAVVNLHVRPYAQRALLDGVEIARGEQRIAFTLTPGVVHRIQVEHACCFPFVREFAAGETVPQPFELKVPLRARPAKLRVEADPATRVYVDGKLAGSAGESQRVPLQVPVAATGETPYERTAELTLEADGRPPLRTTLRLRAGTELTFAATQPPLLRAGDDAADAVRDTQP